MFGIKKAFTLAEMMVVMLILSIIMAAMAPVMTTRESALRDNSSPWKWSDDRADAWFGSGPSQSAMIGQRAKETTDGNSRLIINAENSNNSHISFKYDGTIVGRLFLNDKNSMFFNNNGNKNTGSNNLAIG